MEHNNKYPEPDWSQNPPQVVVEATPDGQVTSLLSNPGIKCLGCCGNHIQALKDRAEGVLVNGEEPELPVIRNAVTYAPSWQSHQIAGQIIFACVPLPSCWQCLVPEEKTPAERATKSGLAVPAPGGWPGRN